MRDPTRAARLAIDLKTGRAWPEHAEDMRFYALLLALRFGVPVVSIANANGIADINRIYINQQLTIPPA